MAMSVLNIIKILLDIKKNAPHMYNAREIICFEILI